MSLFSDIGDRIVKAVTPPKDRTNVLKAAAAPFTLGLSLVAPKSVVDLARKTVRYTGLYAQAFVAPVLPAKTQAKIFGLSAEESKQGEVVQKIYRGVYAAAAVATVGVKGYAATAAWKGAGAKAAAAKSAAVNPANFTWQAGAQPANYVELAPNAGAVAAPPNFVSVVAPASGEAAGKAVAAGGAAGGDSGAAQGATFLSRLTAKGKDVVEAAVFVGAARTLGGQGGVGGNAAPSGAGAGTGGGTSIAPSITDAPSSAGSSGGGEPGGNSQLTMVIAVLAALAIGAAWLATRHKGSK